MTSATPFAVAVPQRAGAPREATGRWWYAFDRWLAVPEPNDDFVLA